MKLSNVLSNEQCIGKDVTAQPDHESEWVTASPCEYEGGEGEFYADVWGIDLNAGQKTILYMYGEVCTILGYNEDEKTVRLINRNGETDVEFEIPYSQYESDFGKI